MNCCDVGLFDIDSYEKLICMLNKSIDRNKKDIQRALFKEAIETGTTVRRSASEFGITPHVYDEEMEIFYKETDAFVFELVVSHMREACKEVDRRVIESVDQFVSGPKILCLGDGIGTDTLRFAKAGFRVTYFEFESPSSTFAKQRFDGCDTDGEIRIVHDPEEIPINHYDVVINREVLEHVPRPVQIIEDIWRYLTRDGLAVVTESFSRVNKQFPTHLASNQQYAGLADVLFVREGFRVLNVYPNGRPFVFRKMKKGRALRYYSLFSYYRIKNTLKTLKNVY